jgi:hypothetical protein
VQEKLVCHPVPRFQKVIIIIYGTVFLAYLWCSTFGIFLGYDIWFHLKNGEFIAGNHFIPHKDPFLFSTELLPPRHFTNYEWLFGIITYALFSIGHYEALNTMRTVLIILIITVLFASSLKRSLRTEGLAFASAVFLPGLVLAFLAMFGRYEPRPQLFSGLFLALYFFLLENRSLGWLHYCAMLLITALWTNSHIEIFLGIAAILLTTARQALTPEGRETLIKSRVLLLFLVLLIVLISPASKGLVSQGIQYGTTSTLLQNLVEMFPVDMTIWMKPYGIILIMGALSFIALYLIDRKKPGDLIIFIPYAILPFISSRHIMPATIAVTPIVASALESLLILLMKKEEKWKKALMITVFSLFPITLVAGGSYFFQDKIKPPALATLDESLAYDSQSPYPDAALRFLNRRRLEGRLFCPFHWGNFIIFYDNPFLIKEGSPAIEERALVRKPFIDGMVQTYPLSLLEDYFAILAKPDERRALIEKYKIDLFILPYPETAEDSLYSLISSLLSDKDYRLLYFDDTSMIIASALRFPGQSPYRVLNPAQLHLRVRPPGDLPVEALLKELRESREEEPGERVIKTYIWEGMLLFAEGKTDESLAVMARGESRAPRNALLLYNMAVAFAKKGDGPRGINYLQRSLRADPTFKPALKLRDAILKDAGK